MKKFCLVFLLSLIGYSSICQTDKYTEKLAKFYSEKEYVKAIEYQSKKEPEMASMSLYIKGLSWFMIDQEKKALTYIDAAIEKGPAEAEMYFYKGICHSMLEQGDEAIAALTTAVEMDPYEPRFTSILARVYYIEKNYDLAVVWLEKAVAMNKDDHELYILKGRSHLELRQYNEAITAYEKAYELAEEKPDKKYAHVRIAKSHYLAGNFEKARELLRDHEQQFGDDYEAVALSIQVSYALKDTSGIAGLETMMNDGKKNSRRFPNDLQNKYGVDRFEVQTEMVTVYQGYQNQSDQLYAWRHQFVVSDSSGNELLVVETQLDTTAEDGLTYTICSIRGDSLMKYGTISYDENFDYLHFREDIQKIIAGETEPLELVTGYEAWLEAQKKAKTGGNGMSFQTAIMASSIPAEYEYLREHYPGHRFIMQSLMFHEGVPYDVLRIKTAEGETLDVYFNISDFFGKW